MIEEGYSRHAATQDLVESHARNGAASVALCRYVRHFSLDPVEHCECLLGCLSHCVACLAHGNAKYLCVCTERRQLLASTVEMQY
jgi:hypothetical protein